jgi:lipoprotein-releasing system permease protein
MGQAQDLFDMDETVSLVEMKVEDIFATEQVMETLRARLGEGYFVMDWRQMNEIFFSALRLERLAMFVTISLIVMVAALNIVATLVLMVMEKNRDIGILLSMGSTRKAILWVFMLQGLIIGLLGTIAGLVLGIGLSWIFDHYQLISLPQQVYYLSHVPFLVRPVDFTVVGLMAVAISFLATIYPAWRASRLDPVEALRHE